jgi:hypothetical protein
MSQDSSSSKPRKASPAKVDPEVNAKPGRLIAMSHATGPCTSRCSVSASMAGGPIRAMASTAPRACCAVEATRRRGNQRRAERHSVLGHGHRVTEGGREITCRVDLATIPLYVRAGAILPMDPVKQCTWEKVEAPLTLWVHPGANGAFSWYEDESTSFNFRKGEFMRVIIAWNDAQRRLTMRLANGSKMLAPNKRNIEVRIVGQSGVKSVVFEGKPIDIRL